MLVPLQGAFQDAAVRVAPVPLRPLQGVTNAASSRCCRQSVLFSWGAGAVQGRLCCGTWVLAPAA